MTSCRLALVTTLALAAACGDETPLGVGADPRFATVAAGPPLIAMDVALGGYHACALGPGGTVYCWGANDSGQLGDGTDLDSPLPVPINGTHRFVALTGGGHHHTCGLDGRGEAYCWGQNWFGQLGDGTTADSHVPVRAAPGILFRSLDAGTYHTCGVSVDGTAYCWGSSGPASLTDDGNAFGAPTPERCDNLLPSYRGSQWPCSPTPVAVPGAFSAVSAGLWSTCGLTGSGEAYCAGWNTLWALGNGTTDHATTMTPVSGGHSFDAIDLGAAVGCGLVGTAAYCWGGGVYRYGAAGNGTLDGSSTPMPVAGGLSFASVHPSGANNIYSHTCGLTIEGAAYCWGVNRFGALGTEATLERCNQWMCSSVPVPVAGDIDFVAVATGLSFSCAVGRNHHVYCWGANSSGQLGDGGLQDSLTPVGVKAPGDRGRRPTDVPPSRARSTPIG
jgi:alpha-tubulin suppressor-like RCC1 family protein